MNLCSGSKPTGQRSGRFRIPNGDQPPLQLFPEAGAKMSTSNPFPSPASAEGQDGGYESYDCLP